MPNRYTVILTGKAKDDIAMCSEYIFERSMDLDIALMWEASLQEHLQQLEQFPASYPMFQIRPYRKLLHGNYVVLFRIDETDLEVIVCRVIHSARLIENSGAIESQ